MGGGSGTGGLSVWPKSHPSEPKQALQAASGMDPTNKVIIIVDEDIDPKDPDMVMWAISFAMQPHRDVQVITGRSLVGPLRLCADE